MSSSYKSFEDESLNKSDLAPTESRMNQDNELEESGLTRTTGVLPESRAVSYLI